MKIAFIIVRTLMGLLFLFASIVVLFKLVPKPELSGTVRTFNDGLESVGYFVPLLKVTELLRGLAFVTDRYVPLETVVIAPIIVNIFLFHAFVDQTGLPVADECGLHASESKCCCGSKGSCVAWHRFGAAAGSVLRPGSTRAALASGSTAHESASCNGTLVACCRVDGVPDTRRAADRRQPGSKATAC